LKQAQIKGSDVSCKSFKYTKSTGADSLNTIVKIISGGLTVRMNWKWLLQKKETWPKRIPLNVYITKYPGKKAPLNKNAIQDKLQIKLACA